MCSVLIHRAFHHLFGCIFCNIPIFKHDRGILDIGVQCVQHLPGGSVAVLGQLCHCLFGNIHKCAGHFRCDLPQGLGLVRDLFDRHLHHIVGVKGQMTGKHLVHHDAYGVDVAGAVGLVAFCLLRADIVDAAHCLAHQQLVVCPGDPCNTKIHHPQLPVVQQHDVLGLDIPVDHPVCMGVFQCLEDLRDKVHRFPAAELSSPLVQVLPQGHAVHVFHDDILQIVVDRHVIDLDDVGMVQQRDRLGFVFEAADQIRVVRVFLPQHLYRHHRAHRHRTVVSQHHCLVDVCHAAGADEFPDLVQPVQLFADQIIHDAPPWVPPASAGR